MEAVKGYKGIGMEGAIAKWYAKTGRGRHEQFRMWAERVAEMAPGPEVLEVAPGPGYFAIELAKLGRHHVTGLDISRTFVDIGRQNAAEAGVQVDFQRGNASAMPFPADRFDFIFCSAAFKNFTDPLGALREMHRVLKPGGQALIVDLRRDVSQQDIGKEVDRMGLNAANRVFIKLTFRFMLTKRAYTEAQMQQLIAQTEFSKADTAVNGVGFEIRLTK
jgi:ubiquinone/menaquinone biosynthesis C-methylase UbiE